MEAQVTLQTKIEQALALAEAGDRLVCDLASGKQKWKMCVPPQHDDTDMVLIKLPREVVPALAEALGVAVEALSNIKNHQGEQKWIDQDQFDLDMSEEALAEITKILLPEEKV